VGVDLERVGQKAAGLRASFASESEQDLLERGAGDADAVARAYTALFSAKEAAAKCLGTHMYHAFYYLRLVETGRGRLVLENIAESPKRRIIARACFHAGHVFSLVDGVDMRPVTGTE
jgi:phosphopantetheinyl transferase